MYSTGFKPFVKCLLLRELHTGIIPLDEQLFALGFGEDWEFVQRLRRICRDAFEQRLLVCKPPVNRGGIATL